MPAKSFPVRPDLPLSDVALRGATLSDTAVGDAAVRDAAVRDAAVRDAAVRDAALGGLALGDLGAALHRNPAVVAPDDRTSPAGTGHHGARDSRQAARERSGRDRSGRAAGAAGGRSYAFRRS